MYTGNIDLIGTTGDLASEVEPPLWYPESLDFDFGEAVLCLEDFGSGGGGGGVYFFDAVDGEELQAGPSMGEYELTACPTAPSDEDDLLCWCSFGIAGTGTSMLLFRIESACATVDERLGFRR